MTENGCYLVDEDGGLARPKRSQMGWPVQAKPEKANSGPEGSIAGPRKIKIGARDAV